MAGLAERQMACYSPAFPRAVPERVDASAKQAVAAVKWLIGKPPESEPYR